jgi:4-amino-4-deoxy-L-arabinose transferase-like glycosyltransferase
MVPEELPDESKPTEGKPESDAAGTKPLPFAERQWWVALTIVAICLFSLFLRTADISSRPFNGDEFYNAKVVRHALRVRETQILGSEAEGPIPVLTIPLMAYEHPLLSVYLTRLSVAVCGWNAFGYRIVHVLFGVATGVVLYALAKTAFGTATGLLAMFLLCVNRFHIGFSRLAIQQSAFMFFVVLSAWMFMKAVREKSGRWMLAAGVATGTAYVTKEESALLLPVFFLFLLLSHNHRHWFGRKELYCALLCVLAIAYIDIFRLTRTSADMNLGYYFKGLLSTHVSLCPIKFFLGELLPWSPDGIPEGFEVWVMPDAYRALVMHFATGILCLVGVAYSLPAWRRDDMVRFLLIMFFVVFGFFMFGFTLAECVCTIKPSSTGYRQAVT